MSPNGRGADRSLRLARFGTSDEAEHQRRVNVSDLPCPGSRLQSQSSSLE